MPSFEPHGTGWRGVVRRKLDGKKLCVKRKFNTRREAEAWAYTFESELDKDSGKGYTEQQKAAGITLSALLEKYEQEVTPLKKGATREVYALLRIKSEIGEITLDKLNAKTVATYRDKRLKTVSGSTVNRELNVLSAALNHAKKEWGYQVKNPIADIKRPTSAKGRERRVPQSEIDYILRALQPQRRDKNGKLSTGAQSRWPWFTTAFALESAMRQAEITRIEWKFVKGNTVYLEDTKNGEAATIPITPRAKAIMRLAWWGKKRKGFIFPVTPELIKRAFTRAVIRARAAYLKDCEAANKEPEHDFCVDLHFHDLRHEATSRLAELLPNVIELAAVTRQKDLRMLKRYYHPRASDLAEKLKRKRPS